jgi:cell division protease FtsH
MLDIPDIGEREDILKVHAQGMPVGKSVALRRVAERTPGFSGADLANLINEAAILTVRRGKKQIGTSELFESIEKVLLGPERKGHVFSEKEKEIAAYHEAGHAIVAHVLPHVDPVRKISIVSRGRAGGYTLKLPEEDKHLHSRAEFFGELATLMGGYAAELVKYEELTTGASNDLKRATQLARSIVTQYGMSELGPITFGEREELVFLGRDLGEQRNYSEETASRIDTEVSRILNEARKRAEKVIREQNDKWELIARTLVEKETIEQEEFLELLGEAPKGRAAHGTSGTDATTGTAPVTDIVDQPKPTVDPSTAPAGA